MPAIVDHLLDLFERQGHAAYLGESVSQAEHALQAGWLAEQAGASPALVVAALLHDVGHLVDDAAGDPAAMDRDTAHEELGARLLEAHFGPDVFRPVQMHVAAKRFLCATDPGYQSALSPASAASLRLQGGPMSPAEVEAFRADPHADAAVRLRRWDEEAKVPGLRTPDLAHFRAHLERVARG